MCDNIHNKGMLITVMILSGIQTESLDKQCRPEAGAVSS